MARRLLSHLLITLGVFFLTVTMFVFVIDNVLLNPKKLNSALERADVNTALANAIPEIATKDANVDEKADMKSKISKVVTPAYVSTKVEGITTSVISFMRNGNPEPLIDLSDFPAQLRASGVEVGSDIDKNFSEPIELNKEGKLDQVPKVYKSFKLAKMIGVVLCILLLVAEWFVAARGEKQKRIGRIFLHTSLWFFLFWGAVIFVPSKLAPNIKKEVTDSNVSTLIDSVIKAVQNLFGAYFLGFAIACGAIAASLYILRTVERKGTESKAKSAAKAQGSVAKKK